MFTGRRLYQEEISRVPLLLIERFLFSSVLDNFMIPDNKKERGGFVHQAFRGPFVLAELCAGVRVCR